MKILLAKKRVIARIVLDHYRSDCEDNVDS